MGQRLCVSRQNFADEDYEERKGSSWDWERVANEVATLLRTPPPISALEVKPFVGLLPSLEKEIRVLSQSPLNSDDPRLKTCKLLHESILSLEAPIRTLPSELLHQIFELARPQYWCVDSRILTLWSIAQTCWTWRHVCMGSPSLWKDLYLPFGSVPQLTSLASLKRHLDCSAGFALNVVISFPPLFYSTTTKIVITELLNHSSRLQSLEIAGDLGHIAYLFHLFAKSAFPRLRRLCLAHHSSGTRLFDMSTVHQAFQHTPALRSLEVSCILIQPVAIPWHQITHFAGQSLDGDNVRIALSRMHRLVECKLSNVSPTSEDFVMPRLANSSLRHLATIHGEAPVLHSTFPSLKHLEIDIEFMTRHNQNSLITLGNFFSRSQCRLTFLRLDGLGRRDSTFSVSPIRGILLSQYELEFLDFGYNSGSYFSLFMRILSSSAEPIWPSLKIVTLMGCGSYNPVPLETPGIKDGIQSFFEMERLIPHLLPSLQALRVDGITVDTGGLRKLLALEEASSWITLSNLLEDRTNSCESLPGLSRLKRLRRNDVTII